MSYKKLDEGNSIGIGYQDTDGHHHLLSQPPSLSLLEQHDTRASLSEPLTKATTTNSSNNDRIYDNPSDPFYVFREDLQQQLSLVDEALSEYLRVVYQTVSSLVFTCGRPSVVCAPNLCLVSECIKVIIRDVVLVMILHDRQLILSENFVLNKQEKLLFKLHNLYNRIPLPIRMN